MQRRRRFTAGGAGGGVAAVPSSLSSLSTENNTGAATPTPTTTTATTTTTAAAAKPAAPMTRMHRRRMRSMMASKAKAATKEAAPTTTETTTATTAVVSTPVLAPALPSRIPSRLPPLPPATTNKQIVVKEKEEQQEPSSVAVDNFSIASSPSLLSTEVQLVEPPETTADTEVANNEADNNASAAHALLTTIITPSLSTTISTASSLSKDPSIVTLSKEDPSVSKEQSSTAAVVEGGIVESSDSITTTATFVAEAVITSGSASTSASASISTPISTSTPTLTSTAPHKATIGSSGGEGKVESESLEEEQGTREGEEEGGGEQGLEDSGLGDSAWWNIPKKISEGQETVDDDAVEGVFSPVPHHFSPPHKHKKKVQLQQPKEAILGGIDDSEHSAVVPFSQAPHHFTPRTTKGKVQQPPPQQAPPAGIYNNNKDGIDDSEHSAILFSKAPQHHFTQQSQQQALKSTLNLLDDEITEAESNVTEADVTEAEVDAAHSYLTVSEAEVDVDKDIDVTEAEVDAAHSYLTVSEAEVDAANAYVLKEAASDVVDVDAVSEADTTEVDKYAIDEDASFSSPERKRKNSNTDKSPARVLSPEEVYETFLSPTTTTTEKKKAKKSKKKSGGTNSNLTATIRELVQESDEVEDQQQQDQEEEESNLTAHIRELVKESEVEEDQEEDQDEVSTRTPSSLSSSKGKVKKKSKKSSKKKSSIDSKESSSKKSKKGKKKKKRSGSGGTSKMMNPSYNELSGDDDSVWETEDENHQEKDNNNATHHGIHHGIGLLDEVELPTATTTTTSSPWRKVKTSMLEEKKKKKKKKRKSSISNSIGTSSSCSSIFDLATGAELEEEVKNEVPYWQKKEKKKNSTTRNSNRPDFEDDAENENKKVKKKEKKKENSHYWGTLPQSLKDHGSTEQQTSSIAKGREAIRRISAMKTPPTTTTNTDDDTSAAATAAATTTPPMHEATPTTVDDAGEEENNNNNNKWNYIYPEKKENTMLESSSSSSHPTKQEKEDDILSSSVHQNDDIPRNPTTSLWGRKQEPPTTRSTNTEEEDEKDHQHKWKYPYPDTKNKEDSNTTMTEESSSSPRPKEEEETTGGGGLLDGINIPPVSPWVTNKKKAVTMGNLRTIPSGDSLNTDDDNDDDGDVEQESSSLSPNRAGGRSAGSGYDGIPPNPPKSPWATVQRSLKSLKSLAPPMIDKADAADAAGGGGAAAATVGIVNVPSKQESLSGGGGGMYQGISLRSTGSSSGVGVDVDAPLSEHKSLVSSSRPTLGGSRGGGGGIYSSMSLRSIGSGSGHSVGVIDAPTEEKSSLLSRPILGGSRGGVGGRGIYSGVSLRSIGSSSGGDGGSGGGGIYQGINLRSTGNGGGDSGDNYQGTSVQPLSTVKAVTNDDNDDIDAIDVPQESPWMKKKQALSSTSSSSRSVGGGGGGGIYQGISLRSIGGESVGGSHPEELSPASADINNPGTKKYCHDGRRNQGVSVRSSSVGGLDVIGMSPLSPWTPSQTTTTTTLMNKKKAGHAMHSLLPPLVSGTQYEYEYIDTDGDADDDVDTNNDGNDNNSLNALFDIPSSLKEESNVAATAADPTDIFEQSVKDRMSIFGASASTMTSPSPQQRRRPSNKKSHITTNVDASSSSSSSALPLPPLLPPTSRTPQASNKNLHNTRSPSSDLLNSVGGSVKNRTKVWGSSSNSSIGGVQSGKKITTTGQYRSNRGGSYDESSSIGTGGDSLSLEDRELFLTKSISSEENNNNDTDFTTMKKMHASAPIMSVKRRMAAWTKSPASNKSGGGTIPKAIISSRRQSAPAIAQDYDTNSLREASSIEEASITDAPSEISESNDNPSKARTWTVARTAFANGRLSLKKTGSPHPSTVDGHKQQQQERAHKNLRKIDPQNLRREGVTKKKKAEWMAFGLGDSIHDSNDQQPPITSIRVPNHHQGDTNPETDKEDLELKSRSTSSRTHEFHSARAEVATSTASPLYSATKLRKVKPPTEDKWKTIRHSISASTTPLNSVETPTVDTSKKETDGSDQASGFHVQHSWMPKKDGGPNTEDKRSDTVSVAPLYSATKLRKVEPPTEDKWKTIRNSISASTTLNSVETPTVDKCKKSSDGREKAGGDDVTKDGGQIAKDSVSPLYSATKLRKIEPPTEDKWKKIRHSISSSTTPLNSAATPLKSVGTPKEDNWKGRQAIEINEDRNDDDEKLVSPERTPIYDTMQLKKVKPSKDEKVKVPTNEVENTAAVLYSTQQLRPVTPPIEEKWKEKEVVDDVSEIVVTKGEVPESFGQGGMPAGETTGEMKIDGPKTVERSREEDDAADESEAEITDLPLGKKVSDGNQRLLMLMSSTSGRQEQKTAQDRALTILKGMRIVGPPQLEQLDGADPTHLARRNELFALSGIRGHYPQFFLVGAGGKVEFFADWEHFELLNDAGRLAQSMNLAETETETYTYPLITPAVIPAQEDTVGRSSTVGDNEFHLMEQQASSVVEHSIPSAIMEEPNDTVDVHEPTHERRTEIDRPSENAALTASCIQIQDAVGRTVCEQDSAVDNSIPSVSMEEQNDNVVDETTNDIITEVKRQSESEALPASLIQTQDAVGSSTVCEQDSAVDNIIPSVSMEEQNDNVDDEPTHERRTEIERQSDSEALTASCIQTQDAVGSTVCEQDSAVDNIIPSVSMDEQNDNVDVEPTHTRRTEIERQSESEALTSHKQVFEDIVFTPLPIEDDIIFEYNENDAKKSLSTGSVPTTADLVSLSIEGIIEGNDGSIDVNDEGIEPPLSTSDNTSHDTAAVIKIQSLARGYISRIQVNKMVQELIDEIQIVKANRNSSTKAQISSTTVPEASIAAVEDKERQEVVDENVPQVEERKEKDVTDEIGASHHAVTSAQPRKLTDDEEGEELKRDGELSTKKEDSFHEIKKNDPVELSKKKCDSFCATNLDRYLELNHAIELPSNIINRDVDRDTTAEVEHVVDDDVDDDDDKNENYDTESQLHPIEDEGDAAAEAEEKFDDDDDDSDNGATWLAAEVAKRKQIAAQVAHLAAEEKELAREQKEANQLAVEEEERTHRVAEAEAALQLVEEQLAEEQERARQQEEADRSLAAEEEEQEHARQQEETDRVAAEEEQVRARQQEEADRSAAEEKQEHARQQEEVFKERWDTLRMESRSIMTRRILEGWELLPEGCGGSECHLSPLVSKLGQKECVVCGGTGSGCDGVYTDEDAKSENSTVVHLNTLPNTTTKCDKVEEDVLTYGEEIDLEEKRNIAGKEIDRLAAEEEQERARQQDEADRLAAEEKQVAKEQERARQQEEADRLAAEEKQVAKEQERVRQQEEADRLAAKEVEFAKEQERERAREQEEADRLAAEEEQVLEEQERVRQQEEAVRLAAKEEEFAKEQERQRQQADREEEVAKKLERARQQEEAVRLVAKEEEFAKEQERQRQQEEEEEVAKELERARQQEETAHEEEEFAKEHSDNDSDEEDDDFRLDLALRKTSHQKIEEHSVRPLQDRMASMVSEGGWSDDDSNTVQSDHTDMSWGTIGSAIVVDATILSKEDTTKHLSKATASHQAKPKDENAKEQDIVFAPLPNVEIQIDDVHEEDEKIKGSSRKKKKKKDPKKLASTTTATRTVEDDISFDYTEIDTKKISTTAVSEEENIGDDEYEDDGDINDTIDDTAPSKKKKKKKKEKEATSKFQRRRRRQGDQP